MLNFSHIEPLQALFKKKHLEMFILYSYIINAANYSKKLFSNLKNTTV
jgi:hypothetical protein